MLGCGERCKIVHGVSGGKGVGEVKGDVPARRCYKFDI